MSDAEEQVTLVDKDDDVIGAAPKRAVHVDGRLHRAVSVFLFDSAERVLLQQRALTKYHSPGLWSNTCCGHPRPGESSIDAAARRLREEMGISSRLTDVLAFEYRTEVGEGLIEHELDHVFVGHFDGAPRPDPAEVHSWRWVPYRSLIKACRNRPDKYTPWLPLALAELHSRDGGDVPTEALS